MINQNFKILVCDDDESLCYLLKEQLFEKGIPVSTVLDGKQAIELIKKKNYDLVLLDLKMKYVSGEEVLAFIKDYNPSLRVIVITGQSEVGKAIECMRMGAFDYKVKPYDFEDLYLTIQRALEHKNLVLQNELLTQKVKKSYSNKIIGESQNLKKLMLLAEKSAASDSNILIEGETGTGKELLAEFIHQNSSRKNKPFVVINCASLPDSLIESELFGYEKGAFTDAKSAKQGLVEIADGGTLFLDEIGEMSLNIQPKILRFLENGDYRRVGGINNLSSNVRVIGATNKNLIHDAEKKLFRKDLLFRLNVITLTIPPLRDRVEDIELLADYFLKKKSPIRSPKELSIGALEKLKSYNFPGNVRELDHIIERAIIFSEGNIIEEEFLFLPSIRFYDEQKIFIPKSTISESEVQTLEEIEKKYIEKVLELNNWERTKTALQLGISQKTLYNKIKQLNLKPQESEYSKN